MCSFLFVKFIFQLLLAIIVYQKFNIIFKWGETLEDGDRDGKFQASAMTCYSPLLCVLAALFLCWSFMESGGACSKQIVPPAQEICARRDFSLFVRAFAYPRFWDITDPVTIFSIMPVVRYT
ncbi:hypothetical protein JKP88DRAFT_244629 [Tribonema minus]|uniref:Uncharacterized protein n=1 Tax=Tribonema minus TaxID=303371 RepID=A0A835Z2W1_9STRA|nr:hypothetical protein JKP88DRAFT_244629 [Tribonema minus]